MKRFFMISICFFLLSGGPAWGRARQFIPRYVGFAGNFQVNTLYETAKNETSSSTSSSSDMAFVESLNFRGNGFIYSPLFVSMQTSVGLGLKQERITAAGRDTESFSKDSYTFKQAFKILPLHPYNLELYYRRSTPMTGGRTGQSGSLVTNEYAARAIYLKRPWSTELSYINNQTEGATPNTETQSLHYILSYFQEDVNITGLYNHSQADRGSDTDKGSGDLYNINMFKLFGKARLTGRWSEERRESDKIVSGVAINSLIKQRRMHGGLSVELPMNFSSNLSYNSNNRDDRRTEAGIARYIFGNSQNYNFQLHHRLFKSLRTSFNSSFNKTESTGGETSLQSYNIQGDYSKKMRWGSILTGLWYGFSDFDNKGAPITLEPHTITGVNSFDLSDPNVKESSIEVNVKDNDSLVLLTEGVHYNVAPTPNQISFRITITSLPAELTEPISSYSYLVNYAVMDADYMIRTSNWGGSLELPLFNKLITPHYSYTKNWQKELEGVFPGEPADNETNSLGLAFYKKPFKGDITQSWLRSNTRKEDRLKSFVNYKKTFTSFTSGDFTVSYEDNVIRQNSQTADLNETLYSAQTQIHTVFPQKHLTASVTANYSLLKGTGDTNNLSLFSTLGWRLGRVDLNVTAYYTISETETSGFTTKRQNASVEMQLKRELF